MLTLPSKEQMQTKVLDENDIESRMKFVAQYMALELNIKREQRKKVEAMNSRFKDRLGGNSQDEEARDELSQLATKLKSLDLPEETLKITDNEIKKLKQLGPRNQEYHVSLNYLQTIADLPWNVSDEECLEPKRC